MATTQKISANLWFNGVADEAVKYYVSIFKDSRILRSSYYGKEGHEIHKMPEGAVLTIEFELEGTKFIAINAGPEFKFTEAISFVISCDSQDEVDYYWDKLGEGGDKNAQQCGWLKDKYGVSWQVTPAILPDMLSGASNERSERVMKVMMQMKKIIISDLEKAYNAK